MFSDLFGHSHLYCSILSKDGIFVDMMTANLQTDSKCTDYTSLSTTLTVGLTSRDVQSPEFESLQ